MRPTFIFKLLLVSLLLAPELTQCQIKLAKKYVDDSINELTYLKFNTDSTFEYKYSYDIMGDFATGSFRISKDSIFLKYKKDNTISDLERNLTSHTEIQRADTLIMEGHLLYQVKHGVNQKDVPQDTLHHKPPKSWHYRRKYLLFGVYQSQYTRYYMIDEWYAKWANRKWRKAHRELTL